MSRCRKRYSLRLILAKSRLLPLPGEAVSADPEYSDSRIACSIAFGLPLILAATISVCHRDSAVGERRTDDLEVPGLIPVSCVALPILSATHIIISRATHLHSSSFCCCFGDLHHGLRCIGKPRHHETRATGSADPCLPAQRSKSFLGELAQARLPEWP